MGKETVILRAKTVDLFKHKDLTRIQQENSEKNLTEIRNGDFRIDIGIDKCM